MLNVYICITVIGLKHAFIVDKIEQENKIFIRSSQKYLKTEEDMNGRNFYFWLFMHIIFI